jgi:hypothetical protein
VGPQRLRTWPGGARPAAPTSPDSVIRVMGWTKALREGAGGAYGAIPLPG